MIQAAIEEDDVFYIAKNMRQSDRKEVYACRWNDSPEELVDSCMAVTSMSWTFGIERPIAALGAIPIWPGVWNVWMFATDEFPRIGLGLTKFIIRELIPCLNKFSHRVETRSSKGHLHAHAWLKSLGATRESIIKNYGKNGEDFYLFRWEKEQIDKLCKRAEKIKKK